MKKKIAILGSTGSIGRATLDILKKNKANFQVILLTANSNYKIILKQIKEFQPKYFIINDNDVYKKIKKKINLKKNKVQIINKFKNFNFNIKFDITISAIVGIAGLEPTIQFTKISKKILLANKETIICGWHILKKISKNQKTIIPIDSEHFSIYELTKNTKDEDIEKIYITGSGGPFLRIPLRKFKSVKAKDAIRHPNWQMGKKISVDSSTLMNKVLEVLEAYKLFPFSKNKYKIIIHPQSLVHAIVFFKNGQTKFLYHDTDMKIPIANALFNNRLDISKVINKKKNSLKDFLNLKFEPVDKKRFPIVTLISKKIYNNSGGIILNACNEVLVNEFLKNKIAFNSIYPYLKRVFKDKDFKKYAIKRSPNINEIHKIDNWARNITLNLIKKKNEKKYF